MPIVTDYFIKSAPKWSGTIGSGGVADASTTTVPLSSATGLTNGEAYFWSVVTYDENNDKTVVEVGRGTLSGTDLINCARGEEGTAQAHDAGATVEILFTSAQWDRLIDGLSVEHDPDGTHTDITADTIAVSGISSLSDHIDVVDGKSIRDGNNNELLTFSETASAVNELTVKNSATGNAPEIQATGGDTNIDVEIIPKGTGVISVAGTTDYEDNVSADDDIPNKKYVDDQITEGVDIDVAFEVYRTTSTQTITTATATKVQFNAETFDTGSNFDSSTNYRFTAPSAGIYTFGGALTISSLGAGKLILAMLYVNGSEAYRTNVFQANAAGDVTASISAPGIKLATNDYVEVYIYHDHGSDRTIPALKSKNWFTGYKVGNLSA